MVTLSIWVTCFVVSRDYEMVAITYIQFLTEHHVELTFLVWIMSYSLTSHVIQVNMCVVLEELPEVLEEREGHLYLWLASKFRLLER